SRAGQDVAEAAPWIPQTPRAHGEGSPASWRALERGPLLPYALREEASILAAARDLEAADSAWARLSALDSPWAWEAVRCRAELALDRGAPERADSLLAAADRASWPDEDRAQWLVLRVRLAARLADTARALALAGQTMRRYPSSAAAAAAVGVLDTLLLARGQTPSAADDAAAAEVEFRHLDLDHAAARLRSAFADGGPDRWRAGLRLGAMLRLGHPQKAGPRSPGALG